MAQMPKVPTLEKIRKVRPESQRIGEFIEWLRDTKQLQLCVEHRHTEHCYEPHKHDFSCDLRRSPCTKQKDRVCGLADGTLCVVPVRIEKLLEEFFDIDPVAAENERLALLEYARAVHEEKEQLPKAEEPDVCPGCHARNVAHLEGDRMECHDCGIVFIQEPVPPETPDAATQTGMYDHDDVN